MAWAITMQFLWILLWNRRLTKKQPRKVFLFKKGDIDSARNSLKIRLDSYLTDNPLDKLQLLYRNSSWGDERALSPKETWITLEYTVDE